MADWVRATPGVYRNGGWTITKKRQHWFLTDEAGKDVLNGPSLRDVKERFVHWQAYKLKAAKESLRASREAAAAHEKREAALNAPDYHDGLGVTWHDWVERKVGCTREELKREQFRARLDELLETLSDVVYGGLDLDEADFAKIICDAVAEHTGLKLGVVNETCEVAA